MWYLLDLPKRTHTKMRGQSKRLRMSLSREIYLAEQEKRREITRYKMEMKITLPIQRY
jgi:hypothetical protein